MLDLRFRALEVSDLFAIEPQASQRVQVGVPAEMTLDMAVMMAAQPIAWAALDDERVLACFGIAEQFEGAQGIGWSILAENLGYALIPITRFMAHEIATCGLARVELIAKCADLEPAIDYEGPLGPSELIALALRFPTRQMRWATMLGMAPAHVLRCYGAASETYLLYERITPPGSARGLVERAA